MMMMMMPMIRNHHQTLREPFQSYYKIPRGGWRSLDDREGRPGSVTARNQRQRNLDDHVDKEEEEEEEEEEYEEEDDKNDKNDPLFELFIIREEEGDAIIVN